MKNVKTGHTRPVVCLDAGHYGKYNRSNVVPEYYESDMNWKLHLLLKAELEGYGIEVKTTRTSQAKDLELHKRGAASKGCDLFLSIHSNAAGTESTDYPLGIYLVNDDDTNIDEQSKEVAVLLSKVVEKVMQTTGKAQQWSRLSSNDRDGDGKKDDNYYGVLHGARQVGTAGVILEHSFHTNTRATKWLLDDANLAKMAKAEAEALADYYGMTKAPEKAPEKAQETTEKWYRVRKSWKDAKSQIGAYKKLENAKKACKPGFTVYDWNGVAVYAPEKAQAATEKLYRVRKSWKDAASQIGAYKELENAKKACKPGFIVYDWNGVAIYSPPPAGVQLDTAMSFDRAMAGTYKVKASTGLNLRAGASVNKTQLEVMANGSTFQCYGYYTNGWLYGVSESGKMGFCSKAYLVKA